MSGGAPSCMTRDILGHRCWGLNYQLRPYCWYYLTRGTGNWEGDSLLLLLSDQGHWELGRWFLTADTIWPGFWELGRWFLTADTIWPGALRTIWPGTLGTGKVFPHRRPSDQGHWELGRWFLNPCSWDPLIRSIGNWEGDSFTSLTRALGTGKVIHYSWDSLTRGPGVWGIKYALIRDRLTLSLRLVWTQK